MSAKEQVNVSVGDQSVAVNRVGQSAPIVADILGTETLADGRRHIVLDRLVHKPLEHEFEGWYVNGAVVTELTEMRPAKP